MVEMKLFDLFTEEPYEQVVYFYDRDTGLRAVVAIHDTTLGPALGGTRMWAYPSEDEALRDVLRLSRGMTYKSAVAGLNLGGGKAVIMGDPGADKTPALLRTYGRCLERLGGRYITAPDMGTNHHDMDVIAVETGNVVGNTGGSGDPSPFTAHGTWLGLKAAVRDVLGRDSLKGITAAVQGVGNVGYELCRYLHGDGAGLIVADINVSAVERAVKDFNARAVQPEEIYSVPCDVFIPGAQGGVINEFTIPQLKCSIVAGPANNILESDRDGELMHRVGICYVPDYVINAGGLINVADQLCGYDRNRVMDKVSKIHDTVLEVLALARRERIPPYRAAGLLAEERILKGKSKA